MRGINERGFTLLDLMTAIAILAIAVAIAVPQVSAQVNNYSVVKAAEVLASDMRHAKHLAIADNKTVKIRFLPDGQSYVFDYCVPFTTPYVETCGYHKSKTVHLSEYNRNIHINPSTNEFSFGSDSISTNGNVAVTSVGSSLVKTITVNKLGEVTL